MSVMTGMVKEEEIRKNTVPKKSPKWLVNLKTSALPPQSLQTQLGHFIFIQA